MKKQITRSLLFALLAISPLLYYPFRNYLPAYGRRPLVYEMVFFIPYVFCFVTAFLGIKLNQSRIFFTALLWAFLYYLINNSSMVYAGFKVDEIQLVKLLALSSFVVLLLLYLYKEKYILGLWGFVRLLSVVVPVAVSIWLSKKIMPGAYPFLMENPLFNFSFWNLPDLLLLVIGGLLTLLILQKDTSIHHFKYAVYINILPLILSFNFTIGRGHFDIESRIFNVFSYSVMGFVFLYALYRMYWEKVYIDELTGVPNRRAFDEYLKKLGRKYTIAMIDIDHFKTFNDTYGHTEGDNVLRFVAKHIAEQAGTEVFRYGGEEFAAIYKGVAVKQAFNLLDKMREKLASTIFRLRTSEDERKSKTRKSRIHNHENSKIVKVTISVGIAHKTAAKNEAQDVIITADKALYKAKENGRNRCEKIMY